MKFFKLIPILICLSLIFISHVFSFTTNNTTITRVFDKNVAGINDPITVTLTLTNNESSSVLGFYYAEQIPQGLVVSTTSVKINGVTVSNYIFESGSIGDVYPGNVVYRWILETPNAFTENNPIPSGMSTEIVYSITSAQAGTFNLDEFDWVGYYQGGSEAAFGHSEVGDKKSIRIYATISGYLRTSGGAGISGVVMSGLPGSPSTGADGSYSGAVDCGWSGTVTPTLAGYTFSPPSTTYSSVSSNQAQNYTGTVQTFTVSGTDSVTVPERGTAQFQVKLSAQPDSTVSASVSRVSGDSDISVQSGSSLTFTSTNWNTYQTVTLSAAEDADTTNGTATIRISASGIPNKDITATESDNDPSVGISYSINPNASYAYVHGDNQITSWQGSLNDGYFDLSLGDFDFQFYGMPVSSVRISTNGYITIGSNGTGFSNDPIPNVNPPNAIIAPFWDDLILTGLTGERGVWWGILGTAPNRQLVIEWYQVPSHAYGTETYSFEVILYESTDRIKFQYLDVDSGTNHDLGASATVGIENFDGTDGEHFSYNTASLRNGLAIEFIPSGIPNPLNDTTEFVKQQYRDFLNREAEPGGLQYWVGVIDSGAMTRAQVIESFFWSEEFGATIAPIVRLYFAYFLRIPDYGGLMYWIDQFSNGQSLGAISDFFAGSEEFQQRYGTLSNEAFVELIYHNILGRSPDSGGYAYWVGELNSGRQTRGQVMVGFSESDEYKSTSSHEVFVTMMYVGMLRRSPEEGGFNFWVNYLDSGNSGLALIDGFLHSTEYADRF